MTLEARIFPTAASNWATAVMKEQPGEFVYELYAGAPSKPGGFFNVGATSGTERALNGLPLNTWSHLATTYDGTTTRLFVNGVQVATSEAPIVSRILNVATQAGMPRRSHPCRSSSSGRLPTHSTSISDISRCPSR